MSLSNIIELTITRETQTPTRAGFGTPMLLAWGPTAAPDRAVYTSAADMLEDGWSDTDPTYNELVKLFSQNPSPTSATVIKKTSSPPTQGVEILIRDVGDLNTGAKYSIRVGGSAGETAEYEVQAGDTNDDVVAGLTSAINALTLAVTATAGSAGTRKLTVASDSAGDFFVYDQPKNVYLKDTTSTSGDEAADLSNAEDIDDDWYVLLTPQDHSKALVTAWAAEAETRGILYFAQSSDYDVPESDDTDVTDDVMSTLVASAYDRTTLFWHHEIGGGAEAALAGNGLPTDPGSITWAYRTLSGIPVTTREHVAGESGFSEIRDKGAVWYRRTKGLNLSFAGKVASGEYIDVMRGSDWMQARIEENVVALLANADKVPMTDDGIAQVKAEIRSVLSQGVRRKFLSDDPSPTVSAPRAADIPTADKGERILPDIDFEGTLAGAVHKAKIRGRLVL